MPEYKVTLNIPTTYRDIEVEADSPEDAIAAAFMEVSGADDNEFDYARVEDSDGNVVLDEVTVWG